MCDSLSNCVVIVLIAVVILFKKQELKYVVCILPTVILCRWIFVK